MRKFTLLMLLVTLTTSAIFAGGYQVRLQGQKQTGMGLIGTPFAFGASSIFYNPGSLSFMEEKYSFSAGVSPLFASAVFRSEGSDYKAETNNPTGTPFYFYGAGKVTEDLSIGLGVFTPFGSSTSWNADWNGRKLIQEISLSAIFIQPTVSYKINDKFGIGAGLDIVLGSVDLTKELPSPVDGQVNLNGKSTAMGFNVGVFVKPTDKLSIGVDYRSKVNMKVENGDTKFTQIPSSMSETFPSTGNFDAELPLPANLDIGLAYQFSDKFTLALEVNMIFWSVYDSLIIDFKENNETLVDSRNPRIYSNSFIPRIGAEYKFSDVFIGRVGVYYDKTPTNADYFSPETVSLDQIAFTLGLSIMPTEGLSIDLSYLQLEGLESDKQYLPDNFKGTYTTRAFIPGIGVSYNF
ncbi:MAG: outer membrane protein transport protein [Bacteroidales bacterium]|nr:outer membrane protein transport protein [Bacteroidales bacterium]